MTGNTDKASAARDGRLYLWNTRRWELAFMVAAIVALAIYMAASTGEWRLALVIGAVLLAFATAVGLAVRKVLTRQ